MGDLTRGLYETLLTELLAERLGQATLTGEPDLVELRNAEAADRIALHLARVIRQAIELGPDEDRGERGAERDAVDCEDVSWLCRNERQPGDQARRAGVDA